MPSCGSHYLRFIIMLIETIQIKPIGIIHTPHKESNNIPIQPIAAKGIEGYIELLPEYSSGLKDIEGFSHITLIYHFHKIQGFELQVIPFMDTIKHGIFACKSPKRSNAIGISTVRLISAKANVLNIEELDMLDGTPLIDIKPFYPKYDNRTNVKAGWLDKKGEIPESTMFSDERFLV